MHNKSHVLFILILASCLATGTHRQKSAEPPIEKMIREVIRLFHADANKFSREITHLQFFHSLRNKKPDQVTALMRNLDSPTAEASEEPSAPLESSERESEQLQQENDNLHRNHLSHCVYHSQRLLSLAASHGHTELVIRYLQAGTSADAKPKPHAPYGYPILERALVEAARYGHELIVRLLLERGASARELASDTHTPLAEAIITKKVSIARLLLRHGAEIESERTCSPLYRAAFTGLLPVVTDLLARGANPNAVGHKDYQGYPLHGAARAGHIKVAEQLIAAGANLNCQNLQQQTPLIDTLSIGAENPTKQRMIAFLLQNGVRHELQDQQGRRAWVIAANRGYRASLLELAKRGSAELLPKAQRQLGASAEKTYLRSLSTIIQAIVKRQKTLIESGELPNDLANLVFAFEASPSTRDVAHAQKEAAQHPLSLVERFVDWLG